MADTSSARPVTARWPAPAVAAGVAVGVTAVSFSAILIRVADAPALSLSFWRCLLGALALTPAALMARRTRPRLTSAQRRQIAAAGVFLALHFALFISALSLTTVASAVVLVAMSPLFVGVGSARFLGEPPSGRAWTGMAFAMVGALGIAAADLGAADLGQRALLGDVMALGGAVMVAGYLLIGRAARARLPVSVYASGVYWCAAAVLLPACLLTGSQLWGYDTVTWLAIGGLVIGPQLLGHTVFNALLVTLSATVVAIAVLAEPVGATVLAWLLLDELPARWFWLGAPLVLAGVWIAATKAPRQRWRNRRR